MAQKKGNERGWELIGWEWGEGGTQERFGPGVLRFHLQFH